MNGRSAMRCRTQTHHLGMDCGQAIIDIFCAVIESDANCHEMQPSIVNGERDPRQRIGLVERFKCKVGAAPANPKHARRINVPAFLFFRQSVRLNGGAIHAFTAPSNTALPVADHPDCDAPRGDRCARQRWSESQKSPPQVGFLPTVRIAQDWRETRKTHPLRC